MANGGYFFLSNDTLIVNKEGIPDVVESCQATFYNILSTGVESLFPLLADGKEMLLKQVHTDGSFVEGTYEIEKAFTSWTFEFKSECINGLSAIDSQNIDNLVDEWAKTEDCPYDNTEDLKQLLVSLHELSVKALDEGLSMFFRMES